MMKQESLLKFGKRINFDQSQERNDRLHQNLLSFASSLTSHELLQQRQFDSYSEQCLIGLCANCICTHTQIHVQKGTCPDYENIRTTYKKAQESIHGQVQQFKQHKQRIGLINNKVQEKRDKVRQIINITKDEVSLLLGNYFEDKEKNMLREIESQEKKLGLHCENRLESLNSYISRQVSTLVSAAQQLSSNNFLQALPRIRTQQLVSSAKLETDIQQEIVQNQRYNTTITLNKGLLNSLIDILERTITLGFSGIPANRINNTTNRSSNQLSKRQQQNTRRPQSMGKPAQRSFSNEPILIPYSPVSTFSNNRNTQSQVNINQPRYLQAGPQNQTPRQIQQGNKNSNLSEIPDFKNSSKSIDLNGFPKTHLNHIDNSIKTESIIYPNSNYNPLYFQNYNHNNSNQSYISNPQQQGILQQLYNPSVNVNSSSFLQQKGQTGLTKRSKKVGLKLANERETGNIQNKGPGGYF